MFEQVKLDYAFAALEPYIDALTMETHYSKHHATYTKNFNAAVEAAGIAGKSAEQILSSLSNERSFEDIEKEFEGKGYGDFKKAVADAVCAKLEEIQTRYNEILNSNLIETTLANGARRARAIAEEKLNQVQKAIGMEIL